MYSSISILHLLFVSFTPPTRLSFSLLRVDGYNFFHSHHWISTIWTRWERGWHGVRAMLALITSLLLIPRQGIAQTTNVTCTNNSTTSWLFNADGESPWWVDVVSLPLTISSQLGLVKTAISLPF